MMGPVKGKPVDPAQFVPFRPAKVLAEVGGPRSFTFVPADGELYSAHWFDESADRVRYLVVPFSPGLLDRLEAGRISLREALDQPRQWVVDVDNQGSPVAAVRAALDDLPSDEAQRGQRVGRPGRSGPGRDGTGTWSSCHSIRFIAKTWDLGATKKGVCEMQAMNPTILGT